MIRFLPKVGKVVLNWNVKLLKKTKNGNKMWAVRSSMRVGSS